MTPVFESVGLRYLGGARAKPKAVECRMRPLHAESNLAMGYDPVQASGVLVTGFSRGKSEPGETRAFCQLEVKIVGKAIHHMHRPFIKYPLVPEETFINRFT